MTKKDRCVCIGRITRPVGIKGDVKIQPYTSTPAVLAQFKECFLGVFQDRSPSEPVKLRVRCVDSKGQITAQINNCSTRNEAESMRGMYLYVLRSALQPTDDGEYYFVDLQGLAVLDANDCQIGTVWDIKDFGAGAFMEVKLIQGGRDATVPFDKNAILSVDLDVGTVRIDRRFLL